MFHAFTLSHSLINLTILVVFKIFIVFLVFSFFFFEFFFLRKNVTGHFENKNVIFESLGG
jgi:hypothetical protein